MSTERESHGEKEELFQSKKKPEQNIRTFAVSEGLRWKVQCVSDLFYRDVTHFQFFPVYMPGTYDTFMAMHVRFSFHDLGARTIIFRAHLLPPKKRGGGETTICNRIFFAQRRIRSWWFLLVGGSSVGGNIMRIASLFARKIRLWGNWCEKIWKRKKVCFELHLCIKFQESGRQKGAKDRNCFTLARR